CSTNNGCTRTRETHMSSGPPSPNPRTHRTHGSHADACPVVIVVRCMDEQVTTQRTHDQACKRGGPAPPPKSLNFVSHHAGAGETSLDKSGMTGTETRLCIQNSTGQQVLITPAQMERKRRTFSRSSRTRLRQGE
ncbi:hypothetical protein BD309DRAFT_867596, partial [Dichomitus squalens]